MRHICPHHLERYLVLAHDLKPVQQRTHYYQQRQCYGNKVDLFCFFMFREAEPSLVLVLVFEGFVDTFSHGFAMEDEAFRDRRLHTKKY